MQWAVKRAPTSRHYSALTMALRAGGEEAPPTSKEFLTYLRLHGPQASRTNFEKIRSRFNSWQLFSARAINRLGYHYLRAGKFSEAIAAQQLYVAAYPQDANAYDSLGEAYLKAGQKTRGLKNYRKSLALNPENENAAKILKNHADTTEK